MFRRPMMYITSAFAVTILISYYYSVYIALAITIVAGLFLFSKAASIKRQEVSCLIVISMVSGVLCFTFADAEKSAFEGLEGKPFEASFVVSEIEKGGTTDFSGNVSEYLSFTAKLQKMGDHKVKNNEKVIIKYYGDVCEDTIIPGSFVSVSGTVETPAGRRNPACFDYALYLSSLGISYIVVADEMVVDNGADHRSRAGSFAAEICGYLYLLKEEYIAKVEEYSGPKTAGIMKAVLFGDTGEVDEDVLGAFRKNGTAHVMAVSGLHVGMIYGFLCLLWRWKRGRLFFFINVLFFLAYMVLASFSPSVVRAVIMVWMHIIADITNRRYDMASAAFFTALVMLIKEPMYIFNTGFQMSFLAVLTLSLMVPLIKRFYSGVFLVSIAVQAGLTPYIAYVFNYISLASVFVNVPIITLIGMIVPIGMCNMAMMAMIDPFGELLSKILGGLCMMLIELNDMTCIEGLTVFDVRSPAVFLIAAYYLILLTFVSEDGRIMLMRKKTKLIKTTVCAVAAASIMFSIAAGNDFKTDDIVFVDVGQGDCIHIRADKDMIGRKNNYLFDGGGSINYEVGKKTLKPYLLKNGAQKIDAAFVTHLHTDHYKGIAELCREGMIERLYVFEGYKVKEKQILDDTGLSKDKITYLHAGQRVTMGRDVYADILWPEALGDREYERMTADEEDENDLCLIMKITVKDRSLIVTGDVDSACLDSLAERYGEVLDTDILKAAHHGSKYSDSEAFAEAAKPEYAVFQVGKNNFGHPDQGVIENFRQKGIMIYRNDLDGAVAFDIGIKGSIRVRTVKGE